MPTWILAMPPALLLLCKATLLLAVALLAHTTVRRRLSAAHRHLLLASALLSVLLLPLTTAVLPPWALEASTRRGAPAVWRTAVSDDDAQLASVGVTARQDGSTVDAADVRAARVRRSSDAAPAGVSIALVLLATYGAGVLVMLGRLARQQASVRRLARDAVTETDTSWTALLDDLCTTLHLRRRVRLLRSEDAASPMTWGILQPTIVMPAYAAAWSPERRRAVLLHELAHVARWDCLTQSLAALAETLYWFHPGVWWAARRLRVERELACDDAVIAAGMPAKRYAAELLAIARDARPTRHLQVALAFHEPSLLEGRMRAILDGARSRSAARRRTVLAGAALMSALVGAVATAQPRGGAPTLTEDLRIGGDSPELRFTAVDRIAVGRDGAIFVADSGGTRLRLYDRNGRFVRQVGSRGEGPGQFREVIGMTVLPTGELAVYDVFTKRISLYDAQGIFLRSMPSRVGGNWTGNDFYADREGNLYVFGIRYSREGRTPSPAERAKSQRFYLKLSPAGAILDTVDIPNSTAPPERGGFVIMTPEAYLEPFTNRLVYDLAPTGHLVWGYTKTYEFQIDQGGGRSIPVRRSFTPLPLGAEERAEWQGRADFYTRRGGPRSASSGTVIPAEKPAFRDLVVGDDGRIWVHRYAQATKRPLSRPPSDTLPPPLTWREIPTFDVFEADGRFFGTVILPEDTRVLARRGAQLWGVQVNAAKESFVVRYRMN